LYEGKDFESPRVDVWGISDKNLFMEANKVLSKQTKPFFAVIQTADNHRPYTIPKEDLNEFTPIHVSDDSLKRFGFETEPEMNAFRYTDYCYRKFITTAKAEQYFNNTIFIFVGDHGITGDAGDMMPKAWSDQRLTNEHVPLLFYSPALLHSNRINNICSQVDILPTIAGLCGISYTNSTLGQDLLDSNTSHLAFIFDPDINMTGVIKGNYYYRKQLNSNKEELVSVVNNEKPAADANTQSVTNEMRALSDAIYESAKYMLPNNKKKKDAPN
jgi:phosphoglycerol transferase MdoB-like AlkP superfamily enzyme